VGVLTGSTMRRFVSGLCLLLPCSVACGGRSEVQRDPSGGGASAGGGSSAAGAGIGAAGSSRECPVERPGELAPCNFVGGQCNYAVDKCSTASFECLNGAWFRAPQPDGASYDCNSFQAPKLPKDGDSCECFGQLDCTFNDCADRGQLHAICDNTTWHVKEAACPRQACGPGTLSCGAGDVCVIHTGFGPTFACEPNLCARLSKPLACDCAAACSVSEQCSIDSGAVACTCSTCI
jgi:hypothetical protein